MSEIVSRTEARPLFQTRLLGIFSGMALLLAAVGIYGVLAYTVSQRTREIGIRMALGAEVKDVLLMVQRRTLALTFAGVVTGTIGALGTTRILNSYLFDVSPADPAILGGVAALLVLVALAAAWIPARRAGRVDPVVALRYE
jgi:putative ABC transport system permease protein